MAFCSSWSFQREFVEMLIFIGPTNVLIKRKTQTFISSELVQNEDLRITQWNPII